MPELAATCRTAPLVLNIEYDGRPYARMVVGKTVLLGNRPPADVILRCPKMSKRHCLLLHLDDQWHVVDLRSRHGTHVNGVQVEQQSLRDGDEIRTGRCRIRVQAVAPGSDEHARFHRAGQAVVRLSVADGSMPAAGTESAFDTVAEPSTPPVRPRPRPRRSIPQSTDVRKDLAQERPLAMIRTTESLSGAGTPPAVEANLPDSIDEDDDPVGASAAAPPSIRASRAAGRRRAIGLVILTAAGLFFATRLWNAAGQYMTVHATEQTLFERNQAQMVRDISKLGPPARGGSTVATSGKVVESEPTASAN